MDKKTEALKLAEDALKRVRTQDMELVQLSMIALAAIREALTSVPDWASEAKEQPAQQEPVAWKDEQGNVRMTLDSGEIQSSVGYVYSVHGERIKNACIRSDIPNGTPLYTSTPAQRTWVGLTDEDIASLDLSAVTVKDAISDVRAVEAKLKEKNQ